MGIDNVFLYSSVRALLLYLLFVSLNEIERTFFFLNSSFPLAFKKKLFNVYMISWERAFSLSPLRQLFVYLYKGATFLYFRLFAWQIWPFLRTAQIWGGDMEIYAPLLIKTRSYTLIEDGMFNYSEDKNENIPFRTFKRFLAGSLFNGRWGRNPQVEKIILTGLAKIPDHYKNKNVEIVSMERLWQESSEEKKNFILNLFDLTPDDLAMLRGCDVIFLSQPLAYDGYMTEAEQIEMTRRILAPYEPSQVFLKPHPRDPLKYAELFPEVRVWKKPTPMELISLCGVEFKKVITVNSTAALSFSYNLELDWLGKNLDAPCFSHLCEASRKKFNRFAREIPFPSERMASA